MEITLPLSLLRNEDIKKQVENLGRELELFQMLTGERYFFGKP